MNNCDWFSLEQPVAHLKKKKKKASKEQMTCKWIQDNEQGLQHSIKALLVEMLKNNAQNAYPKGGELAWAFSSSKNLSFIF